ncbi:protein-serine O-palmitoleoyltransferase porcupine-like [Paramacrobiotus metropolitanus]|uniref:protein-serine O-palmitoleoyltransferase porcupine-like n=1 Tax=Paramacrobiotus metropolitanus TaxID=2943436 RepID=UPI0024462380|nr:protein-serine O-palmitoleoyltransferase porcupine-like [Paramacrobiotus metropolitanus]
MDVLDFPVYGDYDDGEYEFSNEQYEYVDVSDHSAYNIPFMELVRTCIMPVLTQGLNDAAVVLFCCFASFTVSCIIPESAFWRQRAINAFAALCGLCALFSVFGEDCYLLALVGASGYVLLWLGTAMSVLQFLQLQGFVVVVVAVTYVVLFEFKFGKATVVHKIRGAQMIIFMKILSLAHLDKPLLPSLLEYCGYIFCPGTVVFGPWISLDQYRLWSAKSHLLTVRNLIRSLWNFMQSFCLSFFCLSCSTCLMTWIFPFVINKWAEAYRTAAMFRYSHYFISYLSECTLIGMGITGVPVVKMLKIELPRSLVEVVEFWNIPMRNWLKRHVFWNVRKRLGVPAALAITYAASSLLHGLNFQLSAVLLSLAVFTYGEHRLRRELSEIYSACIQARSCRECQHKNTTKNPFVIATNLAFGVLAIFQLAYLGMMFDASPTQEQGYGYEHTLSKWSAMGFSGHYIALFMMVTQYLLR